MLTTVGNYFGIALIWYFLIGLILVVPFVALIYLLCLLRGRWIQSVKGYRFDRILLEGDLWLGWLNPLLYLLFVYPGMWGPDKFAHRPLQVFSLMVLSAFWLARVCPLASFREDWSRVWTSRIALATILPHVFVVYSQFPLRGEMFMTYILWLNLGLHFLAPMAMTATFARRNNPELQAKFMLMSSLRVRATAWAFGLILLFSGVLSQIHRSEKAGRTFVAENKQKIEEVAATNHVSPQVLAAVIQTAISQTEIWKPTFEGELMAVWLSDAKSHFIISKSLDFSIGPAQIKPTTLQTALIVKDRCNSHAGGDFKNYGAYNGKEYRDAYNPDQHWNLDAVHCGMVSTSLTTKSSKIEAVSLLLNPNGSIEAAGLILGLYAAQWHQSGFDIHDNPAILGTLYQIGFQRSQPHDNPTPNEFGRKVAIAAAHHH